MTRHINLDAVGFVRFTEKTVVDTVLSIKGKAFFLFKAMYFLVYALSGRLPKARLVSAVSVRG